MATRAPEPARTGSLAVRAIAGRIVAVRHELATAAVERCREEIADYRLADDAVLADVFAFAVENVDVLVAGMRDEDGCGIPADQLERARAAGRRRFEQRLSLEAFLHAARVWARVAWDVVIDQARTDRADEREAALRVARQLLCYLDVISTAVSEGYLDELGGRGLLRQDLLDALLAGQGDTEAARRRAGALRLNLSDDYAVVLIRAPGLQEQDARPQPLATQVALDRMVESTRGRLRPAAGALIVGLRHGDVVALYPVDGSPRLDEAKRDCVALIEELDVDVGVGISGWHTGRPAIASAYAEARDAVDIAVVAGIRGRAVGLDEVIVDHMLRSSSHADRILAETLRPLIEYDRTRHASLVDTLRVYLGARLNLTRSAKLLSVHPNTVVYRLRRIGELSGRDPRSGDDLLVLSLALRLHDLHEPR